MKTTVILFVSALATTFLVACQSVALNVENSPYYTIPVGSDVTLNQRLNFEPNQVSIYLQYGAIKPPSELDRYDAHCKFELYNMQDTPQHVTPDTFSIVRSTYDEYATQSQRWIFAGLGPHIMVGSVSSIEFTTNLYLKSDNQKNVYLLSCLYWGNPEDNHLTVQQIRQTLGEIMTLELKTP